MTDLIRPGEIMNDTEGKRIHIHGGSILAVDGEYYWYGEDKSQSTPATGRWHSGVRAYRSPTFCPGLTSGRSCQPNLTIPILLYAHRR